jgi:nucleotide-binding universal stress UspA family protein
MSFKKILLAIDDSKVTPDILSQGLEVAKYHQADLMLFRCIPSKDLQVINSIPYEMGLGIETVNYNYQEEQENLNRVTEENLEKIKHECEIATNHQLKIEYKYTIGDPGACICEPLKTGQRR